MFDSTSIVRKTAAKPVANGSVAIPLTMTKSKTPTTKDTSGDGQLSWNGPKAEATSDESFSRGSSKPLKAGAASFKPAKSASKPAPINFLNEGSMPDDGIKRPLILESAATLTPRDVSAAKNKTAVVGPVGSGERQVSPDARVFFTGDMGPNVQLRFPGGHYVKIERIENNDYDAAMSTLTQQFDWERKIYGQKALEGNQASRFITLLVCFDDLRSAAEAENDVELIRQKWQLTHISQAEYAAAPTANGTQAATDPFDGQVILSAEWHGDLKDINTDGLRAAVLEYAEDVGEICAFAEMSKPNTQAVEFRVEYYKISDAKQVLSLITDVQPAEHNEWTIVAKKYIHSPGATPTTPQKSTVHEGPVYVSPTGRTAWGVDKNGKKFVATPTRSVPKYNGRPQDGDRYGSSYRDRFHSAPTPQTQTLATWDGGAAPARAGSWAAGEHYTADTEPQCVSIDRIENGQDVRTTIMLRNIPNRWTCHDLRRILNRTSFGKYDFSYLRIDFLWNTNVGYAFVNFTDPMAIVPFVKQYVGKDWNGGYSRRTAQVSYATVQGYDCLVEKFRNSAIMDEFSDYVPKLWFTDETAPEFISIGTEKAFPQPNNTSKKQRSSDNAGQIGLFAPRSGHRGGADRARRSNYDRGTPRQIEEDAVFNAQNAPFGGAWGQADGGYYQNGPGPVGAPFQPFPYHQHITHYQQQMVPQHFTDPFASGYAPHYFQQPGQFNPPAFHPGYMMQAVNPASQLRTLSHGRLAGRPKNVTVGNTMGMYANVPRTFNEDSQPEASGSGGYGQQYQQQYQQYEQPQQY